MEATIAGDEEVAVGSNNNYTVQVINTGDEYNGALYVFVDGEKRSTIGVAIAAGGKETLDFSAAFSSEGEHTITVCTDSNGNNVIAQKTVTARIAGEVVNGLIADIKIDGLKEENGEYVCYNNQISITYTFTNVTDEDYTGKLQMLYTAGYQTRGQVWTGTLKAKQSFSHVINLQVDYDMTVTFQSNSLVPNTSEEYKISKQIVVRFVKATGIDEVKSDMRKSDDYYNLKGMRVKNPTRPGIYIHNGKKILVK